MTARTPADAARQPLRELLLAAVARAAHTLARDGTRTAPEIADRLRQVALLALRAAALDDAALQGEDAPVGPRAALPPHYLDALVDALLHEAARGGFAVDGAELARLIQALEEPHAVVGRARPQDFARHLASPDAAHALVEIAHDMRSPLTSILFLVETLRRGQSGPVTPVQERQLGLIYGASLGLSALASDLIDAIRGGQRLVDGRPVPFSIADVMLRVCDTVRPISEEKAVPIRHVLPAADGRIGYPAALSRVLLNLMTNALKYTDEGWVAIGCTETGESRVTFWIEDTGQGIPSAVMAMLFDGFRPSASGLRFSNAGLGLAICQHFLKVMGSSLQVESAVHTGTRFSFELDLPRA